MAPSHAADTGIPAGPSKHNEFQTLNITETSRCFEADTSRTHLFWRLQKPHQELREHGNLRYKVARQLEAHAGCPRLHQKYLRISSEEEGV